MSSAIGGYFELELPDGLGELYPESNRYQSATAAFLALLMRCGPSRVWLPWYICSSMTSAPQALGIPVEEYAINNAFDIRDRLPLKKDDLLLYVNYFGVCDRHVDNLLEHYPADQVVIDCAQAFFSAPRKCLATIYSPRKFFGVPDGGYLVSKVDLPAIGGDDDGSIRRCTHLLKRLGEEPESGFADYRAAEASLRGQSPKNMSRLTRRLLESIDYRLARRRRNRNFLQLHEQLGPLNRLALHLQPDVAPLCYPFLGTETGLKERLAARRIFVPTYWPGIAPCAIAQAPTEPRVDPECLALPCDHRYSATHMRRLSHLVRMHEFAPV